eukprot:COSAG05_NODE_1205_length_5533_cov_1.927862_7_plen_38_part_00
MAVFCGVSMVTGDNGDGDDDHDDVDDDDMTLCVVVDV